MYNERTLLDGVTFSDDDSDDGNVQRVFMQVVDLPPLILKLDALESLELANCMSLPEGFETSLPMLKTLALHNTLIPSLPRLPHLQNLTLSVHSDDEKKYIDSLVTNFPSLKSLHLRAFSAGNLVSFSTLFQNGPPSISFGEVYKT